jgi:hypothetical protein
VGNASNAYNPAPWMYCINSVCSDDGAVNEAANPGIIWYWMRENFIPDPARNATCRSLQAKGVTQDGVYFVDPSGFNPVSPSMSLSFSNLPLCFYIFIFPLFFLSFFFFFPIFLFSFSFISLPFLVRFPLFLATDLCFSPLRSQCSAT